MSIMKRLKALRGRFLETVGRLLGHPLVVQVLVSVLGRLLLWLAKLAIIGLLSYVGITIPTI
ncbi:hypothetical protein [Photobacterium leiognathi]|uniref:hypothetical protein n=1 Tax=Photobacterium leiognathi TaxID=553611 RepID=UPI002981957F|nr:hypothetical protein [Photobacterium leiognathi]